VIVLHPLLRPGVDDERDPRNRHARLGDVRGDDDAPRDPRGVPRRERERLALGRQRRVQGQNLDDESLSIAIIVLARARRVFAASRGPAAVRLVLVVGPSRDLGGGALHLVLAGEEHERVPLALAPVHVQRGLDRGPEVALGLLRRVRAPHGVLPPRDAEDGGAAEVLGQAIDVVDRRGGDDELEGRRRWGGVDGSGLVLAPLPLPLRLGGGGSRSRGDDSLEDGHQDVGVEGSLVGLVQDDDVVPREGRVAAELVEEGAVREELDAGTRAGAVLEADAVPDGAGRADRSRAHLARDAPRDGHGGHASRLRDRDAGAGDGGAEQDLRHLRRLPRARLADDDDDRVSREPRRRSRRRAGRRGARSGRRRRGRREGRPAGDPRRAPSRVTTTDEGAEIARPERYSSFSSS
jgi:hypothetical protein